MRECEYINEITTRSTFFFFFFLFFPVFLLFIACLSLTAVLHVYWVRLIHVG